MNYWFIGSLSLFHRLWSYRFLCFFIQISCVVKSQNVLVPFEHFNERNGLPVPVRKIVQDSFGFIWIATTDGLARFDGIRFKVYRNKLSDSLTIPNNIINDLCLDYSGNVWIATNGGLCFFDYQKDQFKQIALPEDLEISDRYRVHCLTIGKNNQIWFATKSAIHQLSQDHKIEYSYYLPFNKNLIIKSLYLNSKEQLYIGTNQSELWMIDICTQNKYTIHIHSNQSKHLDVNTTIRLIVPYKMDTLIIGSWLGGLNKVYFNHNKINWIHYENGIEKDHQKDIITGVGVLHDSLWWVGTFGAGLGLFNPVSGKYSTMIKNKPNNTYSLSSNYINELFIDRIGNIWIATEDGINKYDKLSHQFHSIPIPVQEQEVSVYRKPSCILEDRNDPVSKWLWITIPGVPLIQYNKITQEYKSYKFKNVSASWLTKNKIYDLLYNSNNDLIILFNSGIYVLNEKESTIEKLPLPENCQIENARKIIQDKNGNYWISTSAYGIYHISTTLNNCTHYLNNPNVPNSIPDNNIFCIMEDFQKNIWIGTQNGGLSKFDVSTKQFINFEHKKNNTRSLPDNNVYDLYEDKEHFIWIATENGLARIHPQTYEMKIFTTSEGLANNDIYSITSDSNNKLWLATNNGISVLNLSNGSIRNYFQMDGLASNGMDGATLLTSDHYLFFSTNGIISFCKPDQILINLSKPNTIITSILIYGEEVPLLRTGKELNPININYRQNIFNPEFAALNYTNSSENKYAYILENYDANWIYSGHRSSATYSNLPGGKYTFKVKSANNDGIWSEGGDQINIIVHPPYWKTWWFIATIVSVLLALFYLFYRININQLIRMQQLRLNIARDLHDEIGSTLSSIYLTSHMAQQQIENRNLKVNLLHRIQSASGKAIEMMNEIVWSVKPENDQLHILLARMRQYCSEILEAASISFQFKNNEENLPRTIPLDKRKEIILIFKEAINNLAKYSNATTADIILYISKHSLMLTIVDNGIGFDLQKTFSGNGLKNMKDRAAAMNAEFTMNSIPGRGTRIELLVNFNK